ncbi:MAG: BolA/IbaG family iron-sulfur metabolism protein [Alphaproteobacteria bacterium]|jgi:stress-induced morphogen|tara:strand:- start:7614 stop:7850 length:237 start_codon:yes stop_codon:yes gene_type:complete
MTSSDLIRFIKEKLPDANVEINDLAGDNDHYSATITSRSFVGKNRIEQHQLVHDALKDKLGTELHALTIKTITPKEEG